MIQIAFTIALACLLSSGALQPAFAKGKPEETSAAFCWLARGYRALADSDKQAESVARSRGVSEVDIAKAKRCRRSALIYLRPGAGLALFSRYRNS